MVAICPYFRFKPAEFLAMSQIIINRLSTFMPENQIVKNNKRQHTVNSAQWHMPKQMLQLILPFVSSIRFPGPLDFLFHFAYLLYPKPYTYHPSSSAHHSLSAAWHANILCIKASVNFNNLSRNISRLIGHQKSHQISNFLRLAKASSRNSIF